MFIHVTSVQYLTDYKYQIEFSDARKGVADLEATLWGPMFEPLRNPELFRTGKLSDTLETITWNNGADLAPEYLYELTFGESPQTHVAEPPPPYSAP
jgi:hypothetical protein